VCGSAPEDVRKAATTWGDSEEEDDAADEDVEEEEEEDEIETEEVAEWRRIYRRIDWKDTDGSEDTTGTAEEFVKSPEFVNRKLCKLYRNGLKKLMNAHNYKIRLLSSELKPIRRKLKELTHQAEVLTSERKCACQVMASGTLSRVGAPPSISQAARFKCKLDEGDVLPAIEVNASGNKITDLAGIVMDAMGAGELSEEDRCWVCTDEAALRKDPDLLGMCPGGKPHLNKEQLEKAKMSKCLCLICVCNSKLKDTLAKLAEVQAQRDKLKEQIDTHKEDKSNAAEVRGMIRGTSDRCGDPVFFQEEGDSTAFRGKKTVARFEHAKQEWSRLKATLSEADLPLRVCFLDKSGSMGCDNVTYTVLQLALKNCLHPISGSTLTFLFAGPGETVIFLRRPGDPPMRFQVTLGSATWYNEPVVRTLRILSPLMERIDTVAWMKKHGQAPLQVMCVTDGMDNCSVEELNSLQKVVEEVKKIDGPATHKRIYMPVAGPMKPIMNKVEATGQVPVWFVVLACGMQGEEVAGSKFPKEVVRLDCVVSPQPLEDLPEEEEEEEEDEEDEGEAGDKDGAEEADGAEDGTSAAPAATSVEGVTGGSTVASRARHRMATAKLKRRSASSFSNGWSVGHRIRLRAKEPGRAPKAGTVVRVNWPEEEVKEGEEEEAKERSVDVMPRLDLLMDDETEITVDPSMLMGRPPKAVSQLSVTDAKKKVVAAVDSGLAARTADPEMQRLQLYTVVDSVTLDMSLLMNSGENKLTVESATSKINGDSEEVTGELAAAVMAHIGEAQEAATITKETKEIEGDPPDALQLLMNCLVSMGRSAAKLLPEDRLVVQRLISAALELLVTGGTIWPSQVLQQLGAYAGVSQARAMRRVPIDAEHLEDWYASLSLPCEELLTFLKDNGILKSRETPLGEALSVNEEARGALHALWRFFDPSLTPSGFEDALRRAVNRFQRLSAARPARRVSRSPSGRSGSPARGRRPASPTSPVWKLAPEE